MSRETIEQNLHRLCEGRPAQVKFHDFTPSGSVFYCVLEVRGRDDNAALYCKSDYHVFELDRGSYSDYILGSPQAVKAIEVALQQNAYAMLRRWHHENGIAYEER